MTTERRVNFSREEIFIRRIKVIVNLDGYHSYRNKIEKQNLEVVLIPILSVPVLAFVTSSCIIQYSFLNPEHLKSN